MGTVDKSFVLNVHETPKKIIKSKKINKNSKTMNKTRNGGRRIPKRPKLPQLNMRFASNQQFSPEVHTNFNLSNSSNSSPGSSSPAKINDDCNIFLGSELDALDKDFLNSQKISTILS